jgi:glycosyltransferase involved in cell wall biosynthesis
MFSVVIPAHNSAAFIGEALESVLAQTHNDFELIVVDDASTDNTLDVIQSWKLRFGTKLVAIANRENKGPAGARNTGIRKSKGDFVAFLDSDDLWMPEHLANAYDAFQRHGDKVGVFVGAAQMGESGRLYHSSHEFTWPGAEPQQASSQLLKGCYFHLNSFCIRSTLLHELGGFREELICYEDWLFYLLLSKKTLFVHSPAVECLIRRRNASVSNCGTRMSKPMYRDWIKAYLIIESLGLWSAAELHTMRENFIAGHARELADYLCGFSFDNVRWMLGPLLETGPSGQKVWLPILWRGFNQFIARGVRKANPLKPSAIPH